MADLRAALALTPDDRRIVFALGDLSGQCGPSEAPR
jgi:hypothetical protein